MANKSLNLASKPILKAILKNLEKLNRPIGDPMRRSTPHKHVTSNCLNKQTIKKIISSFHTKITHEVGSRGLDEYDQGVYKWLWIANQNNGVFRNITVKPNNMSRPIIMNY